MNNRLDDDVHRSDVSEDSKHKILVIEEVLIITHCSFARNVQ